MDLGSIFFISGVLILVVVFISQPFVRHKPSHLPESGRQISSLLAEQEYIINALLELDFDYNLGKIPQEDYPAQRNTLLTRGAVVMQQLDTLQRNRAPGKRVSKDATKGENIPPAKSSKAVRKRERVTKRPLTTPDDDLETLLAARRRERGEKAGGFCPQCGNPVQQSDRFCSRCGEALSPAEKNQ